MHFIFCMGRCHYAGNDSGYLPKPSLRVHGNGPFPACLFLDLDLMAVIVSGIVGHFKIKSTQRLSISECHNGKQIVIHALLTVVIHRGSHEFWTHNLVISR